MKPDELLLSQFDVRVINPEDGRINHVNLGANTNFFAVIKSGRADAEGNTERFFLGFFGYVVKICIDISSSWRLRTSLIPFFLKFDAVIKRGKYESAITEWA